MNNKSFTPKKENIKRNWVFIDAEDKILGKVAVEAAMALTGKNKPTYAPHINMGDKVVVTNASKVVLTGTKSKSKKYHSFSGFPGGLKTVTAGKLMETKPEEVMRMAISGMLPKNKLRKERLTNLYIYR